MTDSLPWQALEWDSGFFGFGVGRLVVMPGSGAEAMAIRQRAASCAVRLLYAACDSADAAARAALTQAGGALVDLKRTYSSTVAAAVAGRVDEEPVDVLPAQPAVGQRRQLRTLAWQSAEFSRFKIDPRMPAGAWRRMYSAWIANSLNGRIADRVLVTRSDNTLSGMVTVALRGTCASIGLLAVRQGQRGRGLGRQLVHAAFDAAHAAALPALSVVTQGGNAAACRTYEACGMMLADEQCIFHLWTD